MSYLVLARKCRPQTFDDVVGQGHVTRTLANAIKMDRVAHGFIFSGVRGVGKTSLARILAKALNCEKGPTPTPCGECDSCKSVTSGSAVDVIEIDGASNNSVDDIRELRETVPYRPVLGRYKIYVIDEVHMLSVSAFNALLKTLEEPPPHVKFIFATTEPHKIPSTILSRCQRYEFRRIPTAAIIERLRRILKDEGISAEDGALSVIGREAEGSMRDGLSILDQVLAAGAEKITTEAVGDLLGVVARQVYYELSRAVIDQDPRACIETIRNVDRQGYDIVTFSRGLLEHLRNLVVAAVCKGDDSILDLPDNEKKDLTDQASSVSNDTIHRMFKHFSEAYEEIARSSHPRILLETALARLADLGEVLPAAALVRRLEEIARNAPKPPAGQRGPTGSGAPPGGRDGFRRDESGGQGTRAGADNSVSSVDRPVPTQEVETPSTAGSPKPDVPPAEASRHKALEVSGESWGELLKDFGARYPSKSSVLERANPSRDSTADRLILEFDRSDDFTISRAKDRELQDGLKSFLLERTGRPVAIEVVACESGGNPTLAKSRLQDDERRRLRETAAREHPLVRGVETAFRGKISRVRISGNSDS